MHQCRLCYGAGISFEPNVNGHYGSFNICYACDGTGTCKHEETSLGFAGYICDMCTAKINRENFGGYNETPTI